ncbi:MAG: hypothetical protein RIT26_2234 [Pseudomonadota bacterium]
MRQQAFMNISVTPDPRRDLSHSSSQLDVICRWIDEHSQENITWEDLIRTSGLDHRLLVRLFQIHKKTTPMAYIRQSRQSLGV